MQDTPLRPYATAAAIAALAYLVLTGIHLTHPTFDAVLTTPADWVNDISFSVGLAGSTIAMLGLVRIALVPRLAGLAFVLGHGLVLIGVLAGLTAGRSPAWFVVVGLPGNVLALAGMVGVAIHAWRRGTLPRWVAVLMPLSVLIGVGMAEFGGTVVAAALWGTVAARLTAAQPSAALA